MTLKIIMVIIRLLAASYLLFRAYAETGVWTTVVLALAVLTIEMQNIVIHIYIRKLCWLSTKQIGLEDDP